ncbi:MAG: hypothetical protein QM736_05855 [Vicinamibacterales bacterium]
MFNALFKIPMQFFILLLGALVFVFYQFERPPVFFNQTAWHQQVVGASGEKLRALEDDFNAAHAEKQAAPARVGRRRTRRRRSRRRRRATAALAAHQRTEAARTATKTAPARGRPEDADHRRRLRFHHLHRRPPAARTHRPARRRVLRRDVLLEIRRAQRPRLDHHRRLLPSCASAPRHEPSGRALRRRSANGARPSGAWWRSSSR